MQQQRGPAHAAPEGGDLTAGERDGRRGASGAVNVGGGVVKFVVDHALHSRPAAAETVSSTPGTRMVPKNECEQKDETKSRRRTTGESSR